LACGKTGSKPARYSDRNALTGFTTDALRDGK
jgi:hypothetical protein